MFTIHFKQVKQTKNALRFEEVDSEGRTPATGTEKIGTLYVKKSALPSQPADIKVTIEVGGE